MSKAWRIVIYFLTSVFVVGLILSACFNWVPINTDIKFYRDATVSICVFSIGLFAVLFQLNTKDIYGHSLKQESHFEIIYLKRQIKAIKNDDIQCKRRLPNRMLVPYIVYAIAIPFSTGLCIINQKTENVPPTKFYTFSVYISYFLLITVIAITVVYMIYVLRVMYSYDWIENRTREICKNIANLQDSASFAKGIFIAADSLRILASDDSSSAYDICKIHDDIMQERLDNAAIDELDYNASAPFMVYFSSLIVACCSSGAGKLNGYNNLICQNDVKAGEIPSDIPSMISFWINKLQDTNTLSDDLWPILLLFVRKEIQIIVSSIANTDHNGIKSRDYLIYSDKIYSCLRNRYFFNESNVLSYLTQRYVEGTAVSDDVFINEQQRERINKLCYLADDFFVSYCR